MLLPLRFASSFRGGERERIVVGWCEDANFRDKNAHVSEVFDRRLDHVAGPFAMLFLI
jgi:hypothetical protein